MKPCPFCLAEIPDEARKCRYCGEWVDGADAGAGPGADPESFAAPRRRRRSFFGRRRYSDDQSLGRAANTYVRFRITMAVVGLVLALLFLIFFFLPGWFSSKKRFEERWNSFPKPGETAPLRQPELPPRPR